MTTPLADAAEPAPPRLVAASRRLGLGPLIALWDARLRTRLGARFAKLAAVAVTLVALILVAVVARSSRADAMLSVVVRSLGWLSWLVAGAVALSASAPANVDEERSVTALASSRGHSVQRIALARTLAVARRIRRLTGVPASLLGLLVLGFARSFSALGARSLFLATTLGYVVVLSSLLAALVAIARALSPERPRSLFIALVVLPHLARAVFPSLPSIPSVLGFLLHHLIVVGGGT